MAEVQQLDQDFRGLAEQMCAADIRWQQEPQDAPGLGAGLSVLSCRLR
jgi:hypothetical protein